VRSITRTLPDAKVQQDIGKNGISLKPGEEAKGFVVTVSEGAAGISGRIVSGADDKPPGISMKVYLVPAEPNSADDVLRYAETEAKADGAFELRNIAPGAYRLVARPASDDDRAESEERPLAWDSPGRNGLRLEGEASKTVIDLGRCQRLKDYRLKYVPLLKPEKRPIKKSA
jgi:hypothetical protein